MSGYFRISAADDPAACFFEIAGTEVPDGATVQWLSFVFRGDDYVRHSPASHFAIMLGATLVRDPVGRPIALSGRGMTLGDTSLATPPETNPHAQRSGFGGARGAQIESFWPGGNFLYRDAVLVPDLLQDALDYQVHLEVDLERRIRVALTRSGAGVEGASVVCAEVQDDPRHPVLAQGTGVLIVLARGPVESGAWSAEFRDIRTGWR